MFYEQRDCKLVVRKFRQLVSSCFSFCYWDFIVNLRQNAYLTSFFLSWRKTATCPVSVKCGMYKSCGEQYLRSSKTEGG